MNLPDHIKLIRLRDGNPLISIWDARELTGRPAQVLFQDAGAPPAVDLSVAHAVIERLRNRAPFPAACPYIVAWEPAADGSAMLALGGMVGEPMSRSNNLTEPVVLHLAMGRVEKTSHWAVRGACCMRRGLKTRTSRFSLPLRQKGALAAARRRWKALKIRPDGFWTARHPGARWTLYWPNCARRKRGSGPPAMVRRPQDHRRLSAWATV